MPGHSLGLTLPTLVDTPETQAELTIVALQAIVADLEGKVSVAGLDADGPLDMGGQTIINLAGLRLTDNVPTPAGVGDFYRSGNDAFYVGELGAIQLTKNGTLNGSLLGGFTGDLVHLVATYNHLNNEYTFSSDDSGLSTITSAAVKIKDGTHFVLLKADPAIAADQTLTFYTPPASGLSALTMDSTGRIVPVNLATAQITNEIYLSGANGQVIGDTYTLGGAVAAVNATSVKTGQANILHASASWPVPLNQGFIVGTPVANGWAYGAPGTQPLWTVNAPAAATSAWFPLPGVQEGDTVDSVTVTGNFSAGTYSIDLVSSDSAGVGGFAAVNFTGAGLGTYVPAQGHQITGTSTKSWYWRINAPAGANVTVYAASVQSSR